MVSRRKAREVVLRALYMSECRNMHVSEVFTEMEAIDREIAESGDDEEVQHLHHFSFGLDPKQKEFALSLAGKVVKNKDVLNSYLVPVLKNWDFNRISRIDRIIMWVALAEMLYMLDIPMTVSINEAIEIAKKYSSEKSPAFVNGVLDSASRSLKTDINS